RVVPVIVWPPAGDAATGADSVTGVAGVAAACEIVKAVPATVTVPVLAAPVLAATANTTAPFPVPEAPCEIVMKPAPLVDVHAHPVPAVTAIVPLPPSAPKLDALGAAAAVVHAGVAGDGVVVELLPVHAAIGSDKASSNAAKGSLAFVITSKNTP